ncbi:MAG: alpha/beta fold hydrolase [Bryobacteraceae bacterium]
MRTLLLLAAAIASAQPFYSDKADLLYWLDDAGTRHSIANRKDWREHRRKHVLENMQKAMGPLPAASAAPLDVQVIEEQRTAKYVRRKITYVAEAGDRVPAYLFLPVAKGRHPAMLCLHQTTRFGKAEPAGIDGKPNLHYAQELAERGYVALAPDYPNYGDYKIDVYAAGYASATMKGIVNHRRAVDLLVSLPQVRAGRIGVIGHSLGGHNSLFIAAFDERLKAVLTSCGFNSFFKYYGGNLKGWSHKGYMPRIAELYGTDPAKMPFDFTEVLGAIAPRAVFINAPKRDANFELSGVEDCVRAASPVFRLYGKSGRLVAVHPDAEHDFPPDVRQQAYAFLDRVLR